MINDVQTSIKIFLGVPTNDQVYEPAHVTGTGSKPNTPARDPDFESKCLSGQMGTDIVYWDLQYQGVADPRGRATGAQACYANRDIPKGTRATYTPPRFEEGQDMARGHLIARSLGGDGRKPENIVPLYQQANRTMLSNKIDKECTEHWIRQRIKNGEAIYYEVVPWYYAGTVPAGLQIAVEGDSGMPAYFSILNRKY